MMRLAAAVLSLMIAMPVAAAPGKTTPEAGSAAAGAVSSAPRLKFKSGRPVCMCANGLSEKDIERAANRRADKPAGPRPTTSDTTRSDK